jgi:hypothetical protein
MKDKVLCVNKIVLLKMSMFIQTAQAAETYIAEGLALKLDEQKM